MLSEEYRNNRKITVSKTVQIYILHLHFRGAYENGHSTFSIGDLTTSCGESFENVGWQTPKKVFWTKYNAPQLVRAGDHDKRSMVFKQEEGVVDLWKLNQISPMIPITMYNEWKVEEGIRRQDETVWRRISLLSQLMRLVLLLYIVACCRIRAGFLLYTAASPRLAATVRGFRISDETVTQLCWASHFGRQSHWHCSRLALSSCILKLLGRLATHSNSSVFRRAVRQYCVHGTWAWTIHECRDIPQIVCVMFSLLAECRHGS